MTKTSGMLPSPSEPRRSNAVGVFGACSAAAIALPAWSGALALDPRAGVLGAVLYGAVVVRGWHIAAGRLARRDFAALAGITGAGILAGEWIVARFVASETGVEPMQVMRHAFREPPSWGGIAFATALLGMWLTARRLADPEPRPLPQVLPAHHEQDVVLARAASE